MGKKRIIALLAVLLAFALATGAVNAFGAVYPVTVKDASGNELVIQSELKRIVSIVPSVTEMVYAAGLGDRLVGVTEWCTYPEEAKKLPKVGDMNINVEAVLALRPDLVVADPSMSGATIGKLRELGLKVLSLKSDNLQEMLTSLRTLGKAGGSEAKAETLASSLEARINKVKELAAKATTRPLVFVEIWNEPLMTAGKGTYVDELITIAGGRNVAGEVSGWPVFSLETVIKADPYLVILTNFNKTEFLGRKAWSGVSAVKSGRVAEVNPDLYVRSGPRLVDGLEEMAKMVHPEIFGK